MINLREKDTNRSLGQISEDQLQYLIDNLPIEDLRHETRRAHRVNRTSGAKGVANGKEFTTCSAGSRAAEAIQSAAALSATNKAVVRRRSVPSATNVASAPHGAAPDLTFRRPGYADTIDPGPAGSTSHGNLRSQLGTLKRGKRHGLNGV